MCCASREPAQNFAQYIDTDAGTGRYIPITLEEHWNSEHMRSVRRRMLAGETLPECAVCNDQLLNTSVYRTYFDHLFAHKLEQVYSSTDSTGATTMQPVSWDYRFSNLCNFKCRTCGDMLSSAWESESRAMNTINWADSKNNWMQPDIRGQIHAFQTGQIEYEFSSAVEQHRVEEVYWVGGEPLMYEQHWRYMKRIIELGDGKNVYARYNTNLSRIDYRGTNLYHDILQHMRDWQICASLDGTGAIGEYIRTGMVYGTFLKNFRQGLEYATTKRQMRLDFTLTLPGLLEVAAVQSLATELGVELLSKVMFSFTPDIVMSPLSLPRALLTEILDELIADCTHDSMRDVLTQLKKRPVFEEQWPQEASAGLLAGKKRILQLESHRSAATSMAEILGNDKRLLEWWNQIA